MGNGRVFTHLVPTRFLIGSYSVPSAMANSKIWHQCQYITSLEKFGVHTWGGGGPRALKSHQYVNRNSGLPRKRAPVFIYWRNCELAWTCYGPALLLFSM
jgi:hypothetical protein